MKGRIISTPEGSSARFTSSKVRESIFNMLDSIEDKRVLDLFSGSGIFAFESLSRGAAFSTLVEIEKKTAAFLKKNIKKMDVEQRCMLLNMDVKDAVPFLYKKGDIYDIIFMDPPYEQGFVSDTMLLFRNNFIYDKDTVFVVECSKREKLEIDRLKGWYEIKTRRYGDTLIVLFKSGLL